MSDIDKARILANISLDDATYGNRQVAHIVEFRMDQWKETIIRRNAQ